MIDWTKPIEAVEKATGRVVPMTFRNKRDDRTYNTTDAPDGYTSNAQWYPDGRNWCSRNAWFVRNVETPQSRRWPPRSSLTLAITGTMCSIPMRGGGGWHISRRFTRWPVAFRRKRNAMLSQMLSRITLDELVSSN